MSNMFTARSPFSPREVRENKAEQEAEVLNKTSYASALAAQFAEQEKLRVLHQVEARMHSNFRRLLY